MWHSFAGPNGVCLRVRIQLGGAIAGSGPGPGAAIAAVGNAQGAGIRSVKAMPHQPVTAFFRAKTGEGVKLWPMLFRPTLQLLPPRPDVLARFRGGRVPPGTPRKGHAGELVLSNPSREDGADAQRERN